MTSAVWPSTLPQYVQESGYGETIQDQAIESSVESGPAKIRRRFTKSIRRFQCVMYMTPSQADTFENFWQNTVKGGSLSFSWVHPRTRQAAVLRFRNPAPQLSTMGGGATVVYSFTLELV
jgi:hypothetical protein